MLEWFFEECSDLLPREMALNVHYIYDFPVLFIGKTSYSMVY